MGANNVAKRLIDGAGVVDVTIEFVMARLALWTRLSEERRDLSGLDDRMLRDIGVTRAEADREAQRPFWDAPTQR